MYPISNTTLYCIGFPFNRSMNCHMGCAKPTDLDLCDFSALRLAVRDQMRLKTPNATQAKPDKSCQFSDETGESCHLLLSIVPHLNWPTERDGIVTCNLSPPHGFGEWLIAECERTSLQGAAGWLAPLAVHLWRVSCWFVVSQSTGNSFRITNSLSLHPTTCCSRTVKCSFIPAGV